MIIRGRPAIVLGGSLPSHTTRSSPRTRTLITSLPFQDVEASDPDHSPNSDSEAPWSLSAKGSEVISDRVLGEDQNRVLGHQRVVGNVTTEWGGLSFARF